MRGYWNNPEETAKAFRDGFFRTGDIGRRDSAGYSYIMDRLKDMIVTGGEKVYSGEVEGVIYRHLAVREVAVFGVPDPDPIKAYRKLTGQHHPPYLWSLLLRSEYQQTKKAPQATKGVDSVGVGKVK